MPSFARDHCNEVVLRVFYLRDGEIDDLLLNSLPFFVTRIEMIREPPRVSTSVCVRLLGLNRMVPYVNSLLVFVPSGVVEISIPSLR